jgi:aminoglycoside phosphotransferase family enzyme/predicted kinase
MAAHDPTDTCLEVIDWMRAGAGGALVVDKVIETHCAVVVLAGDRAFKLKKPVDLGYLDFSSFEKRQWALERELAFNQPVAPSVYRALHTINRADDGRLSLGGAGRVIEWALEMRRFDEVAVLSNQPQWVQGDLAEGLGRMVAGFHARADLRPQGGGTGGLGYTITSNALLLRGLGDVLGVMDVEALIAATDTEFAARAALLNQRQSLGLARRCHGDLHLGNLFIENGQPVLFDCIEFNDQLSDSDIQYDLAFLLMDLMFRGNRGGAVRVLSGYLDQAARDFGDAVFEGLACLPLMLAVRAGVRAHVSAQMGQADLAKAYVLAGLEHLKPKPLSLLAVGGLSGSGKSFTARKLAPLHGAVILRSDEIRKRLWGCGPRQALPSEAYGADQSQRVYGQMLHEAALMLKAGQSVVLDAVFMRPDERDAARALAANCGAAFEGLWLEAPVSLLQTRIAARTDDASDADVGVLDLQLAQDTGPMDWLRTASDQDFSKLQ